MDYRYHVDRIMKARRMLSEMMASEMEKLEYNKSVNIAVVYPEYYQRLSRLVGLTRSLLVCNAKLIGWVGLHPNSALEGFLLTIRDLYRDNINDDDDYDEGVFQFDGVSFRLPMNFVSRVVLLRLKPHDEVNVKTFIDTMHYLTIRHHPISPARPKMRVPIDTLLKECKALREMLDEPLSSILSEAQYQQYMDAVFSSNGISPTLYELTRFIIEQTSQVIYLASHFTIQGNKIGLVDY